MNRKGPANVVVTGASSGIGEALAVRLARRGDRLALVARRAELLEQVAAQARSAAADAGAGPPEVLRFAADVTDRAAVRELIAETERRFGGIDLLILNAGIGGTQKVAHWDDESAARILDVNARSCCWAIGAALPGMLARRGGHIVGVSSLAAYRGLPGSAAYCASKAALSTLLESLRLDLRRHGIAVTTVSPGFVRTPLTAKNRNAMPFLVEVEDCARRIVRGIERRSREVRFPWPLVLAQRVLRAMPDRLYDLLASRYDRPPSKS